MIQVVGDAVTSGGRGEKVPDIAYVVTQLSRFLDNPGQQPQWAHRYDHTAVTGLHASGYT
ncbi:hypothetical protein PC116_g21949 [Phytophthora cactorum]|uniref:Uncharacterized protein n=1 Tax=Phytophthora cactorum TaxID=29920 RepID=A0A8T1BYP7_9STRA|nr:hypothetical protein Pcac1_g13751 [Phytophthora cactorum]KAG2884538.1 hypothetical protein PC114_g20051 [Phytophthora cactorum]KAG2911603.1 hypothetical protein PC117_g19110 [Phytophthora cactorum]KAG2988359.1 hypothetical protein PC120_g23403 [Phytophthora cactorum]KAG3139224.1 hypothetical protein C6341_g20447 [Phytophthora cactorum]